MARPVLLPCARQECSVAPVLNFYLAFYYEFYSPCTKKFEFFLPSLPCSCHAARTGGIASTVRGRCTNLLPCCSYAVLSIRKNEFLPKCPVFDESRNGRRMCSSGRLGPSPEYPPPRSDKHCSCLYVSRLACVEACG